MTATVIIISVVLIALILSFFLLSRIRIRVVYDGDIKVTSRYIFIKKQVYPKNEKIKISDYKYKKYQKRLAKKRKQELKEVKKVDNEIVKQTSTEKSNPEKIIKNIKLLLWIVKKVYRRFLRALRIDVNHINITVASDNAAKTAITYGAVYQGVEYLLAFIDENVKVRQKYSEDILIDTDYLSDKSKCDINLVFSVSAARMLDITFVLAYNYIKCKLHGKNNE
ncbi:MAG: hypothetical protein SOZ62_03980 [Eubacteriales bacterium]|nr:hypothetical protein [Eubacteriales bacterium]